MSEEIHETDSNISVICPWIVVDYITTTLKLCSIMLITETFGPGLYQDLETTETKSTKDQEQDKAECYLNVRYLNLLFFAAVRIDQ